MGSGEQPETASNTPRLRPPGTAADAAADTAGHYRWIGFALAATLLLGLGVVFLLPQLVPESPPPANKFEAPEAATAQTQSTTDGRASREQAQQTLQAFLRLRAKLELANAGAWGERHSTAKAPSCTKAPMSRVYREPSKAECTDPIGPSAAKAPSGPVSRPMAPR